MYYSNNSNIVVIPVLIANTVLVHIYTHMWLATLHTLAILYKILYLQQIIISTAVSQASYLQFCRRLLATWYNILFEISAQLQSVVNLHTS